MKKSQPQKDLEGTGEHTGSWDRPLEAWQVALGQVGRSRGRIIQGLGAMKRSLDFILWQLKGFERENDMICFFCKDNAGCFWDDLEVTRGHGETCWGSTFQIADRDLLVGNKINLVGIIASIFYFNE